MNTKIIILFSVFALFQCTTPNTNTMNEEQCTQMDWTVSEMWNNYFLVDNEQSYARLDSALALIDTMFLCNCDVYKFNLVTSKIAILCLKKDFSKALKFTRKMDDTLFLAPYLKPIYLKRIKAIEAQEKGDIATRNRLIQDIVFELEDYLPVPSAEIDSVLKSKDIQDIHKYEKHVAIFQYYFYRTQVEGTDKILNELDSLQNSINGNQEFFDILNDFATMDFIPFTGF